MEKYKSPSPLPDEHMRLVGIIAAHWEWVDLIIERAVAEMMEHEPNRVALLTTNIGFYAKCDLMMIYTRVLEEHDPVAWKQFIAVIVGLKAAYKERNTYVHARWKQDRTTKAWGRSNVRTKGGKLGFSDEPVTETHLAAAAQTIHDAGEAFALFLQKYGILALPNKSAEPPPDPNPGDPRS